MGGLCALLAAVAALGAAAQQHPPEGTAQQAAAQVLQVAGTNQWSGTTAEAKGRPLFSVDFDQLKKNDAEYPVTVYYGPELKPFCWFSAKWDKYSGDSYTQEITNVSGTSGPNEATLSYTLNHPPRHLTMPTQITLVRDVSGATFTLRVRQTLRATGEPSWGDNVEFLHLIINPQYGHDWDDGVPDYVWYRAQREDAADTLPGSHTTLVRMDDNSLRSYPFRVGQGKMAQSGAHHTGAAVAMEATNTIGGWFTKTGVGCIGLVFHTYKASFRNDLTPLHSHCGDGADTHFYLFWGPLFNPLGMGAGDQVEIEYSLTMLPSEPLHTDIEDLNEADLFVFGKEREQKSLITGWLGTKQAIGLARSDGSATLLGIGREPGRVKLSEAAVANAKKVFRIFDLGRPQYQEAKLEDGSVEVQPRWATVVDCGSALRGPDKEAKPQ